MRRTSTPAPVRFLLTWVLSLSLLGPLLPARAQTLPASEGQVADSTELRGLRQLYYATGGAQWTTSTNWLQGTTNADFATWAGVQVSGGDVVGLALAGNHLTGMLPASLATLTGLTSLALENNQLRGTLPAALGQLPALAYCSLRNNQLTGPLPAPTGAGWRQLTYLDARSNQLSGPLPDSLAQCPALTSLYLSYNQFSGPLPASLSQCGQLQWVFLDHNQFAQELPAAWGQLRQLRQLGLGSNQLSGPIPASWGRLRSLQELELSRNQLSGPLPDSLRTLGNLVALSVSDNRLRGSLAPLTSLGNLERVSAERNLLDQPLPAGLGQLAQLYALYLSDNRLPGPLPADLGQAPHLTQLLLGGNRLTGTIPASLLRSPSLRELYLHNNQFSDVEDLGGATGLPALGSLSANQLAFAALERLYQGPGQSRFRGASYNPPGLDARWQRPLAQVDTISYQAGAPLMLAPAVPAPAPHGDAYQWQRLVSGQWVDLPGDTLLTKTWPRAAAGLQGAYRRLEHHRWFRDGLFAPTELASPMVYADLLPYRPRAQNRPDDANPGPVTGLAAPLALAADSARAGDVNFVRTWTPQVALTQAGRVAQAPVDSVALSTQYLDGLGRPVQTVQHQASPQRRDLVLPQAYDGLGREPYHLLPYPAAPVATRQGYHADALSAQDDFYRRTGPVGGGIGPLPSTDPTLGVARTGAAYAETLFEASPLGRVAAQGAAGEAWQLSLGHAVTRQERPNTTADSVLWFVPNYAPTSLDPGYRGFYAPGELWGTDVADSHGPSEPGERGFRTIEWKDKLGQVVLKQVEANRTGTTRTGLHSRWLRTAYVYDDFGRLRFVVQPEGVKQLLTGTGPTDLATGLRLHLPLDQASGSVVADATGRTVAAQLLDSAAWVASPGGPHARALRLEGAARLLAPLAWQPTAFTVAFWVQPSQLSNYSCLLSARPDDTNPDPWGGFAFHTTADGVVAVGFNYWDPNGRLVTAPGVLQAGRWQHLVFTYQGGTGTLYCDGRLVASLAGMPAPQAWPQLRVGSQVSSEPFAGLLSELRVYARALPADHVQQLYRPTMAGTLAPYLFHYRYDERGRQIAKQVPGQNGETILIFDQLDRPVLSQDAQQRQRKEWSWTKYDALGRVVLSGLVTRTDTLGQLPLQALAAADTIGSHQYEQRTANSSYPQHYTTNQSFPKLGQQGFSAGRILMVAYYDDYDFDNDGAADATYDTSLDNQFATGSAPIADQKRTIGYTTRIQTLALNETTSTLNTWLTSTNFYDERARVVQVQATNVRGGTDLVTTQLDFAGAPLRSVARHTGPNHDPIIIIEMMSYDHAGRLIATQQQLPGETHLIPITQLQYNELGQATRKMLGSGSLLQNIDYAYNIRGWLTSINDPYQPDSSDLFNLSLHYEQGFTKGYEQFNGNLTGQTWRGRDGVQRAYGYVYDPLNRLLQGDFVARAGGRLGILSTHQPWNEELDNYRLSSVSYDDNGNILTLRRRGLLQNASRWQSKQYGLVDNLTYTYLGNRLLAVDDQVTDNQLIRPSSYRGAPTSLAGDFQEQGVRLGQEYLYDAAGNMTQDKNKGISNITYNFLDQPTQIHFGTGADSIVFHYTGTGTKIAKLVYQTGKPMQRTDYLGPYQYEGDSLRFFPHAGGRVLRRVSKDPVGLPHVSYQREYTFSDHLGNLRLAYRGGEKRTYSATLEQDSITHKREAQLFDSLSVSSPIAIATPLARTGQYAARLNAGDAQPHPMGPLLQLAVQRGDTLTITAHGLYPQAASGRSFWFSLTSFLANLLSSHPPAPMGGDPGRGRPDLPLLQLGVATGLPALKQLSGNVPKGYLRVLVFNKDSVLVSQRTEQLSQAAYNNYEQLQTQVVLPHDGYVTAYVGNESAVDVFFDDIQVEHQRGLQVQENHYDPYGLNLAGLDYRSPGLRPLNKYKFNGVEFSEDLGLGLNLTLFRLYDPQLGRFHQVDPLADFTPDYSPFAFGEGNPVANSDAEGLAANPGPLLRLWRAVKEAALTAAGFEQHGSYRAGNVYHTFRGNTHHQPAGSGQEGMAQMQLRKESLIVPPLNSPTPELHTAPTTPFVPYNPPIANDPPPPRFRGVPIPPAATRSFAAGISSSNGSSQLADASSVQNVNELAKFLKAYPQMKVLIVGNALNNTRSPAMKITGIDTPAAVLGQLVVMDGKNITAGELLLARARTIMNILVRNGVKPNRIKVRAGGVYNPPASGEDVIQISRPR